MSTDTVDLTFIGRQVKETNAAVQKMTSEVAEMRRAFLMLADKATRTDRHIAEVKDDIELLVKSELMGSILNLETKVAALLEDHTSRLEGKLDEVLLALGRGPAVPSA